MYEYHLTARQPDGRVVTERVDARSGDEAVEILRQRGCTEIVLHTDEVAAAIFKPSKYERIISPRDMLALRARGRFGRLVWRITLFYKRSWLLNTGCLALFLARRLTKQPYEPLDCWVAVVLAFPLVLALGVQLLGRGGAYNRLLEAVSWGRWDEALRRVRALRGLPPREAAFRAAQALAGLGHVEEGLRVWAPFADGSQIPLWMYWGRVADIYGAAAAWESAIAAMEKAEEAAPENAVVLLELAGLLLRCRRDTSRAKALLERVRCHALSDVVVAVLANVEGMLAVEEGHAHEAIGRLEQSLNGFKTIRTPVVGTVNAQTHGYLALAHAVCGDHEAAARHFRLAEPRLRALRQDDLLARCRQTIRLPMG